MRATPLMLAIALGLGLPTAGVDAASPKAAETLAAHDTLRTYIVVFDEVPAASFRGFGRKDTNRPQLAGSHRELTGARKYSATSAAAVAYTEYLADLRRTRLNDASARVGRPLEPTHVYRHALNGVALQLSSAEAQELAKVPGVKKVAPEFTRFLHTDQGPQWINADDIWSGAANNGTQRRGEGIIVGVIDTGINRTHTSFAVNGISNPLGSFRGYCASTPSACNNKLIGLWDFTDGLASGLRDPVDTDGHGTHTASTAAGNAFGAGFSGVAPNANIIAYKACPGESCQGSALLASIEQAVVDGVDVINYSIGSGPEDPWLTIATAQTDDAEAFLAAREAGIVVAAAAGNDGPNPGTHGNPANAPWVMGVAAASHNGTSFPADSLASFSGRGPVIPFGVVKPDITAPGVQIVAAGISGNTATATLSGTSMATPHIAGAAALLKSVDPARTPDQIISALMLTARNSVTWIGTATPHEQGSGMADLALANKAGLYMDVTGTQFRAARADLATGNAQNLNLPSLGHGNCFRTCTLTRTFKRMPGSAASNYSFQFSMPAGASASANVANFNSTAGGQAVTFTVNVDTPSLVGKWVYGTVTLVNNSGGSLPSLKMPVAVYASPFADPADAQDFADIRRTVSRERDYFDLDVNGMVALPNARFATTGLVTPVSTTQTIAVDPTNDDPYDNVNSNYRRLVSVPATVGAEGPIRYRVHVDTRAPNNDIDLFVGRDYNGNARPDAGEELCFSASAGSTEECVLTFTSEASAIPVWIMVQNFSGPGTDVTVDSAVIAMRPENTTSLVATGPGNVPVNTPFKVRVSYDEPALINGASRVGYLLMQAEAGTNAVEVPIRLTRTGSSFEPFALANNTGRLVHLPTGASHNRLYFDVPPHATAVQFSTTLSTGNVDLYVAHVPNPTGPGIAAAPAWNGNAAFRAATASNNETLTLSGGNLLPGRYYVVPVNAAGAPVRTTVTANISTQGPRAGFLSGQYVNAARDGHGIFVDFAGPQGAPDQWVTVWYTYLEDNTPTWYYSQGASPGANGIWKADLLRVVWNGSATHAVDVGDVIITETGTQTMTMNFNLDGKSGFERMTRVGGGSCPQYNAQTLDVSGHWYSPSLSGFGYTYLATGGANPQEVFIPYVYDGVGFPRWLYGQKNFAAATPTFSLQWFSGFSPLAAQAPLTGTAAGTGTRTLATNNVTNMSVNANFTGALAGNWVQNRAVALLSQRKNCQ